MSSFYQKNYKKEGDIIENSRIFRARVKYELTLRKWKYKELAEKAGISLQTVNQIMIGRDYKEAVEKIAEVLGIKRE